MDNRTYRYFKGTPLYPFGYGLSYNEIAYSDSQISKEKASIGDEITVRTTVKNQGKYSVKEAVQVYVKDVEASCRVPLWQLKGIKVVELAPGEEKQVELTLSKRDFAIIDENGKCIVEPGEFKVSIGGQQPDKRSEELYGRDADIFDIELMGEVQEVEY